MASGTFTRTFTVGSAPPEASSALLREISAATISMEFSVVDQSASGIVLQREFRPWWVWVLCVVLFPVGLIALVVKRTQRVVISLREITAGSEVVVAGPRVKYIERLFDDMPSRLD